MDPNTPLWALAAAAASGALVGAGYGVVKLLSYAADKYLEWSKKRRAQNRAEDAEDEKLIGERWSDVVNRLTSDLQSHEERLKTAEAKNVEILSGLAQCRAEHEGTKRLLKFVFAWGKSRGMKMTAEVEADIREAVGEGPAGSGPHTRLPPSPEEDV